MNDFCDLLGTLGAPVSKIVSVKVKFFNQSIVINYYRLRSFGNKSRKCDESSSGRVLIYKICWCCIMRVYQILSTIEPMTLNSRSNLHLLRSDRMCFDLKVHFHTD